MRKKFISDPDQIVDLRSIHFDKLLTYAEHLIKVLDTQVRKLQSGATILEDSMESSFRSESNMGARKRNKKILSKCTRRMKFWDQNYFKFYVM